MTIIRNSRPYIKEKRKAFALGLQLDNAAFESRIGQDYTVAARNSAAIPITEYGKRFLITADIMYWVQGVSSRVRRSRQKATEAISHPADRPEGKGRDRLFDILRANHMRIKPVRSYVQS